ncbi:hypothetical protein SAMN05428988_5306 [Chitinophaga sp. YR573]|uniref:hypothetical protein n=1 Tax=Chitinophaga sp. YR573 TaxID=1881040 RepID=UPI0008C94A96|nr:hypothetical protein [Chitinophaga sp. YR573]SEW40461.1 hypothetical protein SAMN05428988_5306 [Chitinophaga sp. YR573]
MNIRLSHILTICTILFLAAIGVYIYQFHGGLSGLQGDFGTFGDYLNPVLTFISILLIGFITIRANEITESFNRLEHDLSSRANNVTLSYTQIQLQPQLFLINSILPLSKIQDDESWIIKNAYEAPAINILVRMKFDRSSQAFTKWVNCFSLERDSSLELLWLRHSNVIELIWTDILGTSFFKIEYKDLTGIIEIYSSAGYEEAKREAIKQKNNSFLNRDFIEFTKKNNIDTSKLTRGQFDNFLNIWSLK